MRYLGQEFLTEDGELYRFFKKKMNDRIDSSLDRIRGIICPTEPIWRVWTHIRAVQDSFVRD